MSNEFTQHLTGVFLQGFQSILNPTFINIEKLTFFYGPNSAGKSAILDALKIIDELTSEGGTHIALKHWNFAAERNAIGVEIISSQISWHFDSLHDSYLVWRDRKGDDGEFRHVNFIDSTLGKRIQVEFSGEHFKDIKVAIDSKPIFEIFSYSRQQYSEYHKPVEHGEEDSDDLIWGKLVVYKKNVNFNNFGYHVEDLSRYSNYRKDILYSYHYPLFVNENEETIEINGIHFEPHPATGGVEVDDSVERLLFRTLPKNIEEIEKSDPELAQFYRKHFDKNSSEFSQLKENRAKLYWKIRDIVDDLKLVIQGLFLHVNYAVHHNRVAGNRGLLQSSKPFFCGPKVLSSGFSTEMLQQLGDISSSKYSVALARNFESGFSREIYNGFGNGTFDFINESIKKYLSSMREYKIIARVLEVKESERKEEYVLNDHLVVFLKLIHEKKDIELGFENVGSGISYVFPILTSLWASRLSFVEQPELHLHPRAQCEISDVFIHAYNKGSNSVIESHSEHILLRILRRIRESNKGLLLPNELNLTSADVNIYYFEPLPEGNTRVKKIRIDKEGELIDRWPGGFFSERDGELFL
jgi:AAA15 family ATPase/GTPase